MSPDRNGVLAGSNMPASSDRFYIERLAEWAFIELGDKLSPSHLKFPDARPSFEVQNYNEVGAYVKVTGFNYAGTPAVVTGNWYALPPPNWLDFILWLNPGNDVELEVINYTQVWSCVVSKLSVSNIMAREYLKEGVGKVLFRS
jgi:hypothetical protein